MVKTTVATNNIQVDIHLTHLFMYVHEPGLKNNKLMKYNTYQESILLHLHNKLSTNYMHYH